MEWCSRWYHSKCMGWISNFTHILVVYCLGYLQLNLCCHSNSFTNNHTHSSCTVSHSLHGEDLKGWKGRVVVCVPVILKSWISLLDKSYVYMSTSPFLFPLPSFPLSLPLSPYVPSPYLSPHSFLSLLHLHSPPPIPLSFFTMGKV